MEVKDIKLGHVAFVPKGKWDAAATYGKYSLVEHDCSVWYAKTDNVGVEPAEDSLAWGKMIDGGNLKDALNVNAELDGNVFKVTNRDGETRELDIEALVTEEEKVTVRISSEVASVSASGVTIAVYANHGSAAVKYTTDENGEVSFGAPMGSYYEIDFPEFADAEAISPVGYTATLPTRLIEVTYKAYEGEKETCVVEVKKDVDGTASAYEGVGVTVQIGDDAAVQYTTDTEGKVTFLCAAHKQVTVTMADLSAEGYYLHHSHQKRTFTVYTGGHTEHVTYYQYQVGAFIVDAEGKEYSLDDWTAAGKTKDEAVLIKVSTNNLAKNSALVYFDPVMMSERSYEKKQWYKSNTNFPSIAYGQTYNGIEHTQLMVEDAAELGPDPSPAAEYTLSFSKEVGGVTFNGYLGAALQWVELWANRSYVDEILTALYGSDTKLLSTFTDWKWTSDQNNATYAYNFTSSPLNDFKAFSVSVVPFYAF